jgi:hypothetical protein
MKTLTVRLPEELVADIEAECQQRRRSTSDVVRDRLSRPKINVAKPSSLRVIADLLGSVKGLPKDLSARKKAYLTKTGYGRKHSR